MPQILNIEDQIKVKKSGYLDRILSNNREGPFLMQIWIFFILKGDRLAPLNVTFFILFLETTCTARKAFSQPNFDRKIANHQYFQKTNKN